jgi:hypothetical protein
MANQTHAAERVLAGEAGRDRGVGLLERALSQRM